MRTKYIYIQEKHRDDMSLQDAENLAVDILRQVMEEKINGNNVEMATVTARGYHLYSLPEVTEIITRNH